MSDSLNLLQEPQKFCLAQAFKKKKKKTVYFSFSKELEILHNISSVH